MIIMTDRTETYDAFGTSPVLNNDISTELMRWSRGE